MPNSLKAPHHLGIIIDGNRRWAKEKNLPVFEGHRRGLDKIEKIGEYCFEKGVKILTVYAFSTENWKRAEEEVNYLMELFAMALAENKIKNYKDKGIRMQIIGERNRFSSSLQKLMEKAEEKTKDCQKGIMNLAISYGGRAEITQAVKKIVRENIREEKISEEVIRNNLWTKDMPDPDLIIRTGKEQRLSNFLTWQSAYSELYFSPKYWPDFETKDIDSAFIDFSSRDRRFGR
jgi:undecaprenyl diphosphate synthase